jgi:creatinine amidohydrolase/Fe(II)-dependent formamide hydrolase-like protein
MRSLPLVLAAVFGVAGPIHAQVRWYADLNTTQLRALDRARTVVFMPGAMIEEHGPYLPAGTDGILSEQLTEELTAKLVARRPGWTALVLPPVPLGSSGSNEIGGHFTFPGTIGVRPTTLRTIFMDLADEIGAQGFRWITVVHVHGAPLHNKAMDDASDYFHDTYGGRMVHLWGLVPVLGGWGQALQALTPEQKREEGVSLHAGMDETSLMLHLRPAFVAPGYKTAPIVTGQTLEESFRATRSADWPGYLGSPKLASAEFGKRIWDSFAAAASDHMLRILDGADPSQFRRYGDLLATVPLYQGWINGANAEDERRAARQREWLAKRPPK